MKKTTSHKYIIAFHLSFLLIFLFPACNKNLPEPVPQAEKSMKDLVIPENFNFETSQDVEINFHDNLRSNDTARYKIYLHSEQLQPDTLVYLNEDNEEVTDYVDSHDDINDLVATKVSTTGTFTLTVSVPDYIDKLYLVKNVAGVFTSEIIQISSKSAYYGGGNKSSFYDPADMLYGVNGDKDLFTINPVTGDMTIIDKLPKGSYTCAIDKVNRKLYTISRNKPYPLYRYDLDTQQLDVVANLGMGGPRLDYNDKDGLLYFSTSDRLYSIDPKNGKVLTQKKIAGLHDKSGGDLKFASDGSLYMCTYSGLYRIIFNEEEATAVRISAENLPFKPTSMTIDSQDELWLATSDSHSKLVVMDKKTGGWEYKFSPYNKKINDLTALPLNQTGISQTDTDSDGIIDYYDEYPDDATKAYNTYTPSIYGIGTLAFEDNWPAQGDYDFNDLVVNYQFITVSNANDYVVEIHCNYTIRHIGASYTNGFGFELPFSANLIESVTGYNISAGIVSIDGKGLETNQGNPVVIVCDNVNSSIYKELKVLIKFLNPVSPNVVGAPPFNPFIFVNGDRGREVHMPNYVPTDLANAAFFGTEDDTGNPETGRYYKTSNNLPWAIQISHEFRYPLEGIPINEGYLKFNEWAESGGALFKDWYTDVEGYRNDSKLSLPD